MIRLLRLDLFLISASPTNLKVSVEAQMGKKIKQDQGIDRILGCGNHVNL